MTATAKSGSQALYAYVQKNAMDEFKGVHILFMHVHDGALFHFTDKKPRTLEDMKGLKIRAATRQNSKMIASLGATPVQMPLPQVPEALSKSVVDGAAVPWEGTPAIKLSEIAKYHLDVPAGSARISNSIFLFGMNQAKYDSLPADLKKVIDANSGLATSAWAGEVGFDDVVATYKKVAQDRGNAFYTLPDAEYQKWVKATGGVDEDWIKDAAAKGADGKKLLEEARALVKQYAKGTNASRSLSTQVPPPPSPPGVAGRGVGRRGRPGAGSGIIPARGLSPVSRKTWSVPVIRARCRRP
jgi:TRAP-type C4-dicarboxylate transport system substrate-binding protein